MYIVDDQMPSSCSECKILRVRSSSLGNIGDCPFVGTVISPIGDADCRNRRHEKCPIRDLKDTAMTEHKVITLNEDDIKEILADKFDCDIDNIEIEVSNGDPQYPRASVYAEINII